MNRYDNKYERILINNHFHQEEIINKILNCPVKCIHQQRYTYKYPLNVLFDINNENNEKTETDDAKETPGKINETYGIKINNKYEKYFDDEIDNDDEKEIPGKTFGIEIDDDEINEIDETYGIEIDNKEINEIDDNVCSMCEVFKFSNSNMRCPNHTLNILYKFGL